MWSRRRIESCCVGDYDACAGRGELQLPMAAVLILFFPRLTYVYYLC